MRKSGFNLVELLVVTVIIMLLMAILFPVLQRAKERMAKGDFNRLFATEIQLKIKPADPENDLASRARLIYEVPNRWDFQKINFEDVIASERELDNIVCFENNDIIFLKPDTDTSLLNLPTWDVWLERFDEVRKEYSSGLRPGAECFLRATAEAEKEKERVQKKEGG
ncbi:hypothetical protein AMJ47_02650 [Parcubacteria bacterium DG_72]|nr:MAG: hypothetical protein AMJ47_02650 [Parcubacteria bacterium DG_72]